MTLKEEIEGILHPEKKSLHAPPRAPAGIIAVNMLNTEEINSIVGETEHGLHGEVMNVPSKSIDQLDSKPTIDFNSMPKDYWNWCDSLDTKRCWELARLGKTHRGSTAQLKRDVKNKKEELDMIKELKKIDPNAKNFGNVINEFKDKVERLRMRNES